MSKRTGSGTTNVTVSSAASVNRTDAKYDIFNEIASDQHERMLAGNSFAFSHQLGEDPSMSLSEIRKLVEQMFAGGRFDRIYYKTGKSMATGK